MRMNRHVRNTSTAIGNTISRWRLQDRAQPVLRGAPERNPNDRARKQKRVSKSISPEHVRRDSETDRSVARCREADRDIWRCRVRTQSYTGAYKCGFRSTFADSCALADRIVKRTCAKMKRLLFVLAVSSLCSVCFSIDVQPRADLDPATCTEVGVKCDCTEGNQHIAYYCYRVGEQWNVVEINNCGDEKFCSTVTDDYCDDNLAAECAEPGDFTCTSDGMFPDPIKCDSYHICTDKKGEPGAIHYTGTCTKDYFYNANTTFCSEKECTRSPKQIACNKFQPPKLLPWNPRMYYMCALVGTAGTAFEFRVFKCPNGQPNCQPKLAYQEYLMSSDSSDEWTLPDSAVQEY